MSLEHISGQGHTHETGQSEGKTSTTEALRQQQVKDLMLSEIDPCNTSN